MNKFLALLLTLPILFLISCSDLDNSKNPSSFVDDPLNLNLGQCFNDFNQLDLTAEDGNVDSQNIEVVNCMNPHNHEVTAVYSSIPMSYRSYADPSNDLCVDKSLEILKSVFPNKSSDEFYRIALEFDKIFYTQIYGVYDTYGEIDEEETIVCSVTTKYTLTKTYLAESIKELN